ncbi:MAG TPA: ABC transporter permease [Pyrinomonadaceae bacterium]
MLRFIIRRLLIMIPTVLIIITLTWGLIRLAPGNFYDSEKNIPEAIVKNIRAKYGLDQPWYVQYGRVIVRLFGFQYIPVRDENGKEVVGSNGQLVMKYEWHPYPDFGDSLKYEGQSVNRILATTLPVSITLGLLAYILAMIVGLITGTFAALKQNSKFDYASMAFAMLGISVPNFVLGPLLVLIFSLTLYWLPPARWGGFPSWNLLMPVLTLSALYMAYIARLTRSGMLEVLRADYVRTARAKGLSEKQVIFRHVMRGGLLPVISFSGPALAYLITGTVVVEQIFALPGLGNFFLNANLSRDEPLIIGIVAFLSLAILVFNLLVDIAYAFIDPRIRY